LYKGFLFWEFMEVLFEKVEGYGSGEELMGEWDGT
jgi:hypothetical protein